MKQVLPNGNTVMSNMISESNLDGFAEYLDLVTSSREGKLKQNIPFTLCPDIRGITCLDKCVEMHYTKAVQEILEILSHK